MDKIYECICKGEALIIKSLLVFIVGLVFVAASTRYLGYPINWAVVMAVCLFAWCTFVSADIAWRKNKLMRVDFLVAKLSRKNQNSIELVNLMIIAIFLCALIVFGLWLSSTTRFRTFQGIPGFSDTWVTLSVPVGSALMLITTINKIKGKMAK